MTLDVIYSLADWSGNMNLLHTSLLAGLAALVLGSPVPLRAAADPIPPAATVPNLSGLHDFDFLVGEWHVTHRQLQGRLANSHTWLTFDGTCSLRQVMDGYGNIDDNVLNKPTGAYRAVTLRSYDPKTGLWQIWWLDGRDPAGNLDPAMKGSFSEGIGHFYANDTLNGQPIVVRFIWSHIMSTTLRWEQAFSPDNGKTWETNWISDFQRTH